MRSLIAIGATMLAGLAGTTAQGITFSGMPGKGSYKDVANLAEDGTCTWGPDVQYSGTTSPLDEELSMVMRGPFHLKQFAYYTLDTDSSKAKRSGHLADHRRRAHKHFHEHNKEKREAEASYGDEVTATINGQVVKFKDNWSPAPAGADSAPPAPAPPAADVADGAKSKAKDAEDSKDSKDSKHSKGPDKAPSSAPSVSAGAGNWRRESYYDAASKTAQNIAFLANNNWAHYAGLGAIVGYVTENGQNASTESNVLDDVIIPDNTEIIISSGKPCSDGSCGAVAPGAAAHHGFGGANKVFLAEFQMPKSNQKSADIYSNCDKPAWWGLNTKIVNTQQYAACSCWASGCGEVDIHEILEQGNETGYATMHMGDNYSGQAPQGFPRPTDSTMKMAMIITDHVAHITVLSDSVEFSETLAGSIVSGWIDGDTDRGCLKKTKEKFQVIKGAVPKAKSYTG